MNLAKVFARPSAFLPVLMSLAALTLVLVRVALYGAVREHDEGASAHVFQLLVVGQVPLVIFFSLKWLRRAPRLSIPVLALQAVAAMTALASVACFNL